MVRYGAKGLGGAVPIRAWLGCFPLHLHARELQGEDVVPRFTPLFLYISTNLFLQKVALFIPIREKLYVFIEP